MSKEGVYLKIWLHFLRKKMYTGIMNYKEVWKVIMIMRIIYSYLRNSITSINRINFLRLEFKINHRGYRDSIKDVKADMLFQFFIVNGVKSEYKVDSPLLAPISITLVLVYHINFS